MEAAMELEDDDEGDANEQDDDQFEDDEMLAQPDEDVNEDEDDGQDDEEDINEDDDDGGEEEAQEGVDPNPNAKDLNKEKDTTTVDEKKETPKVAAPVAPIALAETKKAEAKKDDKKEGKPPADNKNIQIRDYEEIPAYEA
jgi:hypothetical protein